MSQCTIDNQYNQLSVNDQLSINVVGSQRGYVAVINKDPIGNMRTRRRSRSFSHQPSSNNDMPTKIQSVGISRSGTLMG
jgi:hypothetical protein